MKCPKCGGTLLRHEYSETLELWRCKDCHGMLLQDGVLERIRAVVRADEYFDVGHPKVGRALNAVGDFACPVCGTDMVSAPHPAQPHVRVEKCPGCAVIWLDAGELLDLSHYSLLERIWKAITGRLGLH